MAINLFLQIESAMLSYTLVEAHIITSVTPHIEEESGVNSNAINVKSVEGGSLVDRKICKKKFQAL